MSTLAVFFLVIVAPILAVCLAWLGWSTLPYNWLGWLLLFIGVGYPLGGLGYGILRKRAFWRSTQQGKVASEERSDRSFWLILPGFLLVFFASPLEFLYFPSFLPRSPWLQAAGGCLFVLGVALRNWTRRHLRIQYSGHLEVQVEHRLVQSGPYRFIRHPGYTGFLAMALGIALGYSSLAGILAVPAVLLPGLVYRIKVEEKLLVGRFGEEYTRYASRTWRLMPGIW